MKKKIRMSKQAGRQAGRRVCVYRIEWIQRVVGNGTESANKMHNICTKASSIHKWYGICCLTFGFLVLRQPLLKSHRVCRNAAKQK